MHHKFDGPAGGWKGRVGWKRLSTSLFICCLCVFALFNSAALTWIVFFNVAIFWFAGVPFFSRLIAHSHVKSIKLILVIFSTNVSFFFVCSSFYESIPLTNYPLLIPNPNDARENTTVMQMLNPSFVLELWVLVISLRWHHWLWDERPTQLLLRYQWSSLVNDWGPRNPNVLLKCLLNKHLSSTWIQEIP